MHWLNSANGLTIVCNFPKIDGCNSLSDALLRGDDADYSDKKRKFAPKFDIR